MMSYAILAFFESGRLPEPLRNVSVPVGMLARSMAAELPVNEETVEGLRKLLEAKDCFVRSKLLQMAQESEPDA